MPYEEGKLMHEVATPPKRVKVVPVPIHDSNGCITGYSISDKDKINNLEIDIHEAGMKWADLHSQCFKQKQLLDKLQGTDPEVESEEYLNLMLDIKRIEKIIRRLDKRSRKSKIDDVTVRCANAIGLLEGKKLLLIQAVTHAKRSHT